MTPAELIQQIDAHRFENISVLPSDTLSVPETEMDLFSHEILRILQVLSGEFWSPSTAHYFIHPNRNSGGIASPSHGSAAILFILSYHSYVSAWLFAAAMTISALMHGCSCWAPIVSASVIRLSIFLAFPSL